MLRWDAINEPEAGKKFVDHVAGRVPAHDTAEPAVSESIVRWDHQETVAVRIPMFRAPSWFGNKFVVTDFKRLSHGR